MTPPAARRTSVPPAKRAPAPRNAPRGSSRVRMTGRERREQLLDIGRKLFAEQGLRGHLGRGDRRPGRGLEAGRLRALRRQGGALRRRRRPRGGAACSAMTGALTATGAPARAARAGRAGAARLHRVLERRLPHPGPRLPGRLRRPARSRRSSATSAPRSSTSSSPSSRPAASTRRTRRSTRRCSSAWSRSPASGGSTSRKPAQGGGGRPPGQPRLERAVRSRGEAAAGVALTPGGRDEVDRLLDAWLAQRPDLDVSPLAVLSRVSRLSRHLDRERRAALDESGLEAWEFDVLAALRRAGSPLTPGQLVTQNLVSSGTMTHRIGRLVDRGLVERAPDPDDRPLRTRAADPRGRRGGRPRDERPGGPGAGAARAARRGRAGRARGGTAYAAAPPGRLRSPRGAARRSGARGDRVLR